MGNLAQTFPQPEAGRRTTQRGAAGKMGEENREENGQRLNCTDQNRNNKWHILQTYITIS